MQVNKKVSKKLQQSHEKAYEECPNQPQQPTDLPVQNSTLQQHESTPWLYQRLTKPPPQFNNTSSAASQSTTTAVTTTVTTTATVTSCKPECHQ
jgi:hypothetical protein